MSVMRSSWPDRRQPAGRVVHRTGDLALMEATLATADDVLVATATATATVIPANYRGD
jgi:acyl-coenzyme A thioesterase PaaI-like protein